MFVTRFDQVAGGQDKLGSIVFKTLTCLEGWSVSSAKRFLEGQFHRAMRVYFLQQALQGQYFPGSHTESNLFTSGCTLLGYFRSLFAAQVNGATTVGENNVRCAG